MKLNRLVFSIEIKAKKNDIWETLWNENYYKEWANVFFEGSYLIANNWNVGSKVLFLAPDQSGIYSRIEEHTPNHSIQFKHIGTVVKGVEQPIDKESKKWSGALERYSLTERKRGNKLTIEIDVLNEHLEFMSNKLPEALVKIRGNCSKLS